MVNRSITIIQDICDLNEQDAQTLYEEGNHIKTAVVMYLCNTTKEDAETRLYKSNGVIKQAINV